MKKIVLLAFVLVLLPTVLSLFVVGLLELQIAYASPYTSINVDTAYNMITNGSYPDLVVLDVRTQSEYDSGHIYGAVWIPHTELEARINELAGHENHEIIVYCKAGGRSATASGILDFYNFTKVNNMLEGMDAWQSAGYPVYIATVHNVNTAFNYDTIQAAIDAPQTLDGNTILVDAGTYYENVHINKSISLIGENRSTTVIDGNRTGDVVDIYSNCVTVKGFTIQNSGFFAGLPSGITIWSENCTIIGNTITSNKGGICLSLFGGNHIITNNTISSNYYGIYITFSANNKIFHNYFLNNTNQTSSTGATNKWDNGYPSGGNYWSDYNGTDMNQDGIGDTSYEIDVDNTDNYPLMGMFSDFSVTHQEETYHVTTICNSTISAFQFDQVNRIIKFNVTGEEGIGFCRVCIPYDLMEPPYTVTVDGHSPQYANYTLYDNGTHRWIYFTYLHSTQEVEIVPEFPSWTSMLLILIVLTVAVAFYKRRILKTLIH